MKERKIYSKEQLEHEMKVMKDSDLIEKIDTLCEDNDKKVIKISYKATDLNPNPQPEWYLYSDVTKEYYLITEDEAIEIYSSNFIPRDLYFRIKDGTFHNGTTTTTTKENSTESNKEKTTAITKANTTNTTIQRDVKHVNFKKLGGIYRVGDKEIADAWLVQQWANEAGISTEVLEFKQTDTYAYAKVRAINRQGQFVDAVVYHDYDTIKEMFAFDLYKKYTNAIEDFDENGKPIWTLDFKKRLYERFIRFKVFALRDAITKACRIAQLKLLNKDWREKEEIDAEIIEIKTVNQS